MSLTIAELVQWAVKQPPTNIVQLFDTENHSSGNYLDFEETNIHLEDAPFHYSDEFVLRSRPADE